MPRKARKDFSLSFNEVFEVIDFSCSGLFKIISTFIKKNIAVKCKFWYDKGVTKKGQR